MESIAKLTWRCRRGTLELDLLLTKYLENDYVNADDEEKAQFIQLLTLEDNQLQAYLIENNLSPCAQLNTLVKKIKANSSNAR